LDKISTLQTPQGILALVNIPEKQKIDPLLLKNKFSLVLNDIQDPGNFGTIIRTADWFGIQNIICSNETVDAYNPKTVQSTMGSLSRIKVYYTDLAAFIEEAKLPVFGALLSGENIYQVNWGKEGLILLGNEGHGIAENLVKKITSAITIPRIGEAESLNVAVSAAIFCSEVSRNMK
jgi:TrmH family RNA methyltransferase